MLGVGMLATTGLGIRMDGERNFMGECLKGRVTRRKGSQVGELKGELNGSS